MKRILSLLTLAAAAPLLTGCGLCCGGAKPGFSFAWQMPPTLSQSAILGPQVTTFGAQGLACGPTAGALGLYSAEAMPGTMRTVERLPIVERYGYERAPYPAQAPAPQAMRSPVPECTLDEVCRMLMALTQRLDRMQGKSAKPQAMPMPKAGKGDDEEGEDLDD